MLLNKTLIGNMDFRLLIQVNTPTNDSTTNEEIDSWSDLTTVWAKREVSGGRVAGAEVFQEDQQVAINTEEFTIRYSTDVDSVDATMRVAESGTTNFFYIIIVEVQKRQGWVKITADKRDNR